MYTEIIKLIIAFFQSATCSCVYIILIAYSINSANINWALSNLNRRRAARGQHWDILTLH